MKQMRDHAGQYMEVKPVSIEHHRKMYYPRIRLGLMQPLGELPPGVKEQIPPPPENQYPLPDTKPKKWGPLISDYGRAGDIVEKQWIRKRIEGSLNEPILGKGKWHIEGIPGRLNPSVDSPQCCSCMTGGTTIALRTTSRIPKDMQRDDKRQVGLYEESFRMWRGNYVPPEHCLGQTDVTSFAGEMVAQKNLM